MNSGLCHAFCMAYVLSMDMKMCSSNCRSTYYSGLVDRFVDSPQLMNIYFNCRRFTSMFRVTSRYAKRFCIDKISSEYSEKVLRHYVGVYSNC
jgi:hypothetical protein